MSLASLCQRGHWLLWLPVAGYLLFIGFEYTQGFRAAAAGDTPLWTDYTPTYGAALLAYAEAPENLYYPRRMAEATRVAANAAYDYSLSAGQIEQIGFPPFMYPPPFILLILPLAFFAYLPSLLLWTAATAVPYLTAMAHILPHRGGLALALAAPPAFYNLMYGQTGFLIAGLIAGGLLCLHPRPWLAGLLIGLASVKPHFGILIPLALAAGGHWRAFISATLTVLGLILASILLLGPDPWYGFIGTSLSSLEGFGAGAYAWHAMTSVLSAAYSAGLDINAAWAVQYLAAAVSAALVIWYWRKGKRHPHAQPLLSALLCLATLLAVPLVYLYDLVLLVPAVGWLWLDLTRRGGQRWEFAVLAGAVVTILPLYWLGRLLGIQPGAACVAVLLALTVYRLRQVLAAATAEPTVNPSRERPCPPSGNC